MTHRGARLALLLLAAISALPRSAVAQDDGGTRSVFANGAGNRGLAMGSAFVAVADDATAAAWNPAGLGLVLRKELVASRTAYDLGFHEEYVTFVLPSWRWGAAGLSIRHFGVDGIDGRDSRNVPTSDDLTSAETEIALSYGRAFGDAWNLGGSLKWQTQRVADLGGSGIGADFGVLARPLRVLESESAWADRFVWGLGVRNLLEPTVRLDRESVPDPMTVRSGVALRWPRVLAAFDVEKSAGTGIRPHGGVEVTVHPMLALRAGLDEGDFTAGAGLQYGDVGVDYAFQDDALGSVHRVGLAWRTGPTTIESRRIAVAAEERKIQERLAVAFRRAQAEQVEELLERAREARRGQDVDEALRQVALARTLDPEHAEALHLERALLHDEAQRLEHQEEFAAASALYGRILSLAPEDETARAGLDRTRAESDRRAERSREIRERFALAMDAFVEEDFAEAAQGFGRILELAPEDAEAARMFERASRSAKRRAEGLLDQAVAHIESGRPDAAEALVKRARTLDPNSERIAVVTSHLRRAKRPRGSTADDEARSAGAPTDTPSRTALTAERRREIERLYERGMKAMRENRIQEAMRYWEIVWSADPSYERVTDFLKQEYLTRGLEAFSSGRPEEALRSWERALAIDPDDGRAAGYVARAREQLTRTREILGASR